MNKDTVCIEHDMNAPIVDAEVKASGEILYFAICPAHGGHQIEVLES
jgi:hypothetical protein